MPLLLLGVAPMLVLFGVVGRLLGGVVLMLVGRLPVGVVLVARAGDERNTASDRVSPPRRLHPQHRSRTAPREVSGRFSERRDTVSGLVWHGASI